MSVLEGSRQLVVGFGYLAGYTLEIFHSPVGLRIVQSGLARLFRTP